jgi:hypothetical protein
MAGLDRDGPSPLSKFLTEPVRVVNVGLEAFADNLRAVDAAVVQLDWTPPAGGDPELADTLLRLDTDEVIAQAINDANREALSRMLEGEPVFRDVVRADAVIPELAEHRLILHAGPPIEWNRMCGPLKGAIAGAIVFEGWAPDLETASVMAESDKIAFAPNHHFGAVGPMTGITTRSMPLMVVANRRFGNEAFCAINEGLGKVMRFGGNDAEVLRRLEWLRDVFGPALGTAVKSAGGIALKGLIARGLTMGDELHQRNIACSSLLLREIAPWLARTTPSSQLPDVLGFIGGNDQFFLNLAMATGKSLTDPANGIRNSSVVTAMCRNGTEFGIKVSGTGDTWFTAPVEMPEGLYFPGFSAADANPDMGDSAIVETIGLGGFAMGASPAVAGFVGAGSASSAGTYTTTMRRITSGENPEWTIPSLDFAGVPTGIDLRLVVGTNVAPVINTGIAHRRPGIGQVGAGIVRAPLACFQQALRELARRLSVQ